MAHTAPTGPAEAAAVPGWPGLPPEDAAAAGPPPSPESVAAEVSLQRIREAEREIRRFFPPTPLLEAPRISRRIGARVWLKLETVTPVRVFKIRGALARIARLPAGMAVVSASTGNHGLAVARAARLAGRCATIFVPRQSNPRKVEAIQAEGARVVQEGADYLEAYQAACRWAKARGLAFVHAYDDPDVIAGQATIALELAPHGPFDCLLCGVGGGGLVSGLALACHHLGLPTRVVGVQSEGAPSMAVSLREGRPVTLSAVRTLAEGLAARQPGARTFAVAQRFVDRVVLVTDDELCEAAAVLLADEQLVAEPSGVAGLAALLRYGPGPFGERLCVVVSGANVSPAVFRELLQRAGRYA